MLETLITACCVLGAIYAVWTSLFTSGSGSGGEPAAEIPDITSHVLKIRVVVYGSCSRDPDDEPNSRSVASRRQCQILLEPEIPRDATTKASKEAWIQEYIKTVSRDFKHNRNWRCEFCNERARMSRLHKSLSWKHNFMSISVHLVCDIDAPECGQILRSIEADWARQNNVRPAPFVRPPMAPGYDFPMFASCAECHDENPKSLRRLKKCVACGLTRYCSVQCQKADRERHKVVCKSVSEVKWVWN
ncbi:DUF2263 domain-containing protein [Mycena chlorophos]|uniref:DUF2263 domain-containing protein n=1 Tax=Mycena chlorophos TaxID=658473 RepID=A0A8H6W459_MYCCL|nr:DUF2263 domain-containing protein [Mycena chlorophos]